jgi:CheY-like chemotaxis protein
MNRRVLVVDDDREVRLLARTILERRGFEVDEAGDASGALAMLELRSPDVVVIDHDLRESVSGLELAATIAALRPAVGVVMFSARLEQGARYPGVDAVVDKAHFPSLAVEVERLGTSRAAPRLP